MREQGTVKKIEGELVWISCEPCATCLHSDRCASADSDCHSASGFFAARRDRAFAARNDKQLQLAPGDLVEYYIAPGKAVKAGFLILIVPILIFFLLYYLTGLLWSEAVEAVRVLAGVGGIVLGFLINLAMKKRIRDLPEITRVVHRQR